MIGSGWKGCAGLAMLASTTAGSASAQAAAGALPHEAPLTVFKVFGDAALPVQAIMGGLGLAVLASVAVCAVARSGKGGARAEASAIALLTGLGASGPLFGLAAAAYTLFAACLGLVNTRSTPDFALLGPAFAEATMAVVLGLLAGAVATLSRGLLRGDVAARPDMPA